MSDTATVPVHRLSTVNPAAGRRLRDFVLTRLDNPEGWSTTLPARLDVSRTAVMAWFAGKEPSGDSFRRLAQVVGEPRYRLVGTWDGDL